MKSKKELKQAYRLHKTVMGVFQIKNLVTGKIFIEGSTDIRAKWNRHQMELKLGNHRNPALQKDWNKYSIENFEFKVLTEIDQSEKDNPNYSEEVKVLENLILEELKIEKSKKY